MKHPSEFSSFDEGTIPGPELMPPRFWEEDENAVKHGNMWILLTKIRISLKIDDFMLY